MYLSVLSRCDRLVAGYHLVSQSRTQCPAIDDPIYAYMIHRLWYHFANETKRLFGLVAHSFYVITSSD